jgi:hypothetical protein
MTDLSPTIARRLVAAEQVRAHRTTNVKGHRSSI